MKKRVLLFCILTLWISFIYGQSNRFSMLDFSFDYFSNTNTFGQFNQIATQPSYSPVVSFFDKSGFNLSVMGNFVENSDTALENMTTEIDVMIGYDVSLGKYIRFFPSYTRFFYIGESNSLKSSFTDNLSLDASFEIINIYGGFNVNYLLGDQEEWFITSYLSYILDFEDIFIRNSLLMIQPEVNFNFNNQTYYSNYLWDNWQKDEDFQNQILNNQKFNRLLRYLQRQYPNLTEQQLYALLVAQYTEVDDEFNLSTIGLTLPVGYAYGNISFNASFSTYFLINKPEYMEEDMQTYFSIGISYTFMWD